MKYYRAKWILFSLILAGFLYSNQALATKIIHHSEPFKKTKMIPLHTITPKPKKLFVYPIREPECPKEEYLLNRALEKSLSFDMPNKKINQYQQLFLENDILQQPKNTKKPLTALLELLCMINTAHSLYPCKE